MIHSINIPLLLALIASTTTVLTVHFAWLYWLTVPALRGYNRPAAYAVGVLAVGIPMTIYQAYYDAAWWHLWAFFGVAGAFLALAYGIEALLEARTTTQRQAALIGEMTTDNEDPRHDEVNPT